MNPFWQRPPAEGAYQARATMEPSTAVAVVAYNRPHYFRLTLQSLLTNADMADCDLWIFLDGGPRAQHDRHCHLVENVLRSAEFLPRRVRILPQREHLDCGRHLIQVRRHLFDEAGYQWVYVFEDDMLVTPHYLGLCRRMLDWAEPQFWNVGAVQAYNACWLSPEEKAARLDSVHAANAHWWGYLLPARTWFQIRQLLYAYEANFLLGRAYHRRDVGRIQRWVQALISDAPLSSQPRQPQSGKGWLGPEWDYRSYFARDTSLGQDAITALALALVGQQKLVPVVNRGLPIGRKGIHMTAASFRRHGLDSMRLDLFESDARRENFVAEAPTAGELRPYMRRDEQQVLSQWFSAQRPRRVLEFGAGGSSLFFSQRLIAGQWWSLESCDEWIERVLHAAADARGDQTLASSAAQQADQRLTLLACPAAQLPELLERLLADVEFDVFVVDGYDRPFVLRRLAAHLTGRSGHVLLHDFNRAEYHTSIAAFAYREQLTPPSGSHQGWLVLRQP